MILKRRLNDNELDVTLEQLCPLQYLLLFRQETDSLRSAGLLIKPTGGNLGRSDFPAAQQQPATALIFCDSV